MPEKVALACSGVCPRELPVDLVLHIAHGDECGDNATPPTSLDWKCANLAEAIGIDIKSITFGADCPIMHEAGRREASAAIRLCEDHSKVSIAALNSTFIDGPVCTDLL